MNLSLADLEQAINYWRALKPSLGEERALSPEVNALASLYALMIFKRLKSLPESAIDEHVLELIASWRSNQ